MRFLKTQSINRRMIYDDRLAIDTSNAIVMHTPENLLIPKGVGDSAYSEGTTNNHRPVSPTNGMIRYNTTTDEFEGYQAGVWRSFKFKEASKIRLQNLGGIDGYSYFYGPLDSTFYDPTNVSSNNPGIDYDGQNILVFIENVFQIFNTNYVITHNPTAGINTNAQSNAGTTTLSFASTATIPTGSVVTGSPYFQSNTIATVTDATTITLSKTISGGNITNGTPITFTAPTGYYINFTSDPVYGSMVGKQITVLLGFDK